MKSVEIETLIRYRLEQAQAALDDAKYLIDGNRSPQSIVNRSYYAMFYAALALLQKICKAPSKHSGVISFFDKEFRRTYAYACSMMHESGHILGIYHSNTPGCDDGNSHHYKMKNWWKWRFTYRSCMNYGRVITVLDYSDGSRGKNDFDDWYRVDLTLFQISRA